MAVSDVLVPTLTRRHLVRAGLELAAAVPFAGGVLAALSLGCSERERGTGEADSTSTAGAKPPAAAEKPAPATSPAPAPPTGAGGAQLVTEIAANAGLVTALKYVNISPNAAQRCENCLFYTAHGDGVGACQLFQSGVVKAGGWCTSWQQKPAT